MKRLLLSSLFFLGGIAISFSQCASGVSYQGGVAPAPGGSTTMTTCAFGGEYQTVTGVTTGEDYVLTYTGGTTGNYVTIYDAGFTAIAWGSSPLSWTATGAGTFYSQSNNDDGTCGTENACHTSVWANNTPPPPCPAEIAPWTEPFTTTVNPACWTQSATSGGPWTYTGNPGYDVAGMLDHTNGVTNNYIWMDFSGTDAGVIITTPEINVNALNVPELRFWEVSHYVSGTLSPYNPLYIEASDGLGGWTLVATYQGEMGPTWVEHTNILSPYIYTVGVDDFVQIRFRAESGGSSADFNNDLLIDDVSVVEAPTCPQPINFMLDSADVATASFSWTPTGSETQWFIEYGAPGFTPGTGMTAPLTTPNPWDQITGLTADTFYEAYVRAYCTPGDTSFYTGPVTFNTYNQGLYMEADNACGAGFIDISGNAGATATGLTYGGEMDIALPFDMVFQGTLVQNMTIGSTGGVLLEAPLGSQVNTFNGVLAGYANGLYPFHESIEADFGDVYYEAIGPLGSQTFIVQWENNNYVNGPAGEEITFQLQIIEATGEIFYVYEDVEFGGSDVFFDYGNSATIGVAGPSQDIQTSYNNQTYLQNNSCAHYYYTNCPLPTNFSVTYTTTDEGAVTWGSGLAGESNWTVIYGPAGFDPSQTGTTVQTGTPALIMPGLNDITTYDVYIYADCSPILQSNGYMGSFTTLPNCADPTGINTLTAVDSVFTDWAWTGNVGYPSTGFGIQYGWTGFTPGTGTIAYVDNNFTDTTADATFIGGGVYQMYVQAICGTDSSNMVGPVTFTMPLSNDSTCLAEDLAVDGTIYTLNNTGATAGAGETAIAPPAAGCNVQNGWCNSTISFSTWFTFTAPPSGDMRIDGGDAGFDGQFAVYEVAQCDSFPTYTLLAANDDGNGLSPMIELCGLTPGAQYYLMHDSWSTVTQGVYSIRLDEIVVEAGTDNGLVDICLGDNIDLFNNIAGYDMGGTWAQDIPTLGLNGSMFNSSGLASQLFGFTYVVMDGCATDTVTASVEIYAPSSAGTDGTIDACMNEPINLLSGLGGNVDLGGQWYDPSNSPTVDDIISSSIGGQFNYDYITGNGVCPDDTANVIVNVDFGCDYLNLQELYFEGMDVYPNPTTGMIYISNDGADDVYSIELTDLNGKVINTIEGAINGTETTEVSLEKLETGFYLIRVFNDNAEKTFRIVKQ